MNSIAVKILGKDATSFDWFAVEEKTKPGTEELRLLGEKMSGGELNPYLRLIAVASHSPVARITAERKADGRIRFWPPTFCRSLSEEEREDCTTRLLDELVNISTSLRGSFVLETRPGDDIPEAERWLSLLIKCDFTEIARGHIYRLELGHFQPRAQSTTLTMQRYDESRLGELVRLYTKVREATRDRFDLALQTTPDKYMADLQKTGENFDAELWIIAVDGDEPVGYVLGTVSDEPTFGGYSAWILEVGVVPGRRRRGAGTELVNTELTALKCKAVPQALALIDDQNTPSLRVHAKFGFERIPGAHMVYQRRL